MTPLLTTLIHSVQFLLFQYVLTNILIYWLSFTVTYREFKLIFFISGHKWPPAFDPLLFEDGDHGHLSFICHHLNGALLGSLSTTRETVQVQLNRTYEDDIYLS